MVKKGEKKPCYMPTDKKASFCKVESDNKCGRERTDGAPPKSSEIR